MIVLTKRFKVVPVFILLASALACERSAGTAGTAEPDRSADESAIRDLFAQNAAAINQRNPAAAAATYTPDGDIWVANGPHVTGVAELREHFERAHPSPDEELEIRVDSIRFLSADVALVESSSTSTLPTGATAGLATLILVRNDSGWKIAVARVMSVEALPR